MQMHDSLHSECLEFLRSHLHGQFAGTSDAVLCCGVVGSLESDIDLLCIVRSSPDASIDLRVCENIMGAVHGVCAAMGQRGAKVVPFTSFHAQVFLSYFSGAHARDTETLAMHVLLYPGLQAFLEAESPTVVKSMLASIREILPTDKTVLDAADRLEQPSVERRLRYYRGILVDALVLMRLANAPAELLIEEAHHKVKYVVKYAVCECLLGAGLIGFKDVAGLKVKRKHLESYVSEDAAESILKYVQDSSSQTIGTSQAACRATNRLVTAMLKEAHSRETLLLRK